MATELSPKNENATCRYIVTGLFIVAYIVTVVFNAMAGPGVGPFTQSTGDISDVHKLPITPSGFTFAIWGIIYFLMAIIVIYAVVILFRRVGLEKSYELGGALPTSYMMILIVNLIFNISWLFTWDRQVMIAGSVILFLIAFTNVIAASLAAKSFDNSANRLASISKPDFWMGLFVLNSHEIYSMWTIIASLLNLGIAIVDSADKTEGPTAIQELKSTVSIAILSVLLLVMISYFIMELTVLKRLGNPFFTHYLVYIWAMIGSYSENGEDEADIVVQLILANLGIGVGLFLLRVASLFCRNWGNAMYANKI